MPYINQVRRNELLDLHVGNADGAISRHDLGMAIGEAMENGGDFQYMVAVALQTFMENNGLRYEKQCEAIMGALTGALGEFQRCVVDVYEAEKAEENGPVYDLSRIPGRKGY